MTPAPFPITFWCGVPPAEATIVRYEEIAGGGFTIAQIGGTREQIVRQLDFCREVGVTGMVIDGRIATTELPSRPRWQDVVREVVADYGWHPALWGYYVLDEPSASDFPALAKIVAELGKRDPRHPAYVNLFPNYANEQQLGTKTYEDHVRRYIEEVKPPLVSYDHYAIMDHGDDHAEYFPNLEVVRRLSQTAGLDFWQIILSIAYHCCRNPTEADLRWQIWTTLAYGAKGVSYFTYWTPASENFRNGIIDPYGERTEHYAQVRVINREVATLGPILLRLRSVGIYHSPAGFNGIKPAPSDAPPRYVLKTNDEPITIGEFSGESNETYLIIVSRRLDRSIAAHFTVKGGFSAMERINRVTGGSEGRTELRKVGRGMEGSLWLAPGDGALVRLHR